MSAAEQQLALPKLNDFQTTTLGDNKVVRGAAPSPELTIQVMDAILELIDHVEQKNIDLAADGAEPDLVGLINQRIAQLDESVNENLNAVIQNDEFQRLEKSWRGLHYLVSRAETSTTLKLRLLNATKDEIGKDLARAV